MKPSQFPNLSMRYLSAQYTEGRGRGYSLFEEEEGEEEAQLSIEARSALRKGLQDGE